MNSAGSRAAFWLALLVAALAAAASAAGLLWGGGSGPWEFPTLRGQGAWMLGQGLYRHDTLFAGAGYQGQDLVTLCLGVPAAFLFAGGAITLAVWLVPLLGVMAAGRPPDLLDSYTTMVTDALDLGLITPAAILGGVLILRREALGYRIALGLLGIILFLMPVIVLSTVFQARAGVSFTAGEIAGPVAGFALLGLFAAWVLAALLSAIPSGRR